MAISWLTALKVVPWDKVLEHAPGVLDKARGFIDKHRTGGVDAPPELVQLAQAQQQMAQALAGEIAMAEPCAGAGLLRLWGCGCAFSEAVVQFANKKPGAQAGVKKMRLEAHFFSK